MSIPITKRVMMGGKKGCGCGCDCQCGNSPAKQAAYDNPREAAKILKQKLRAANTQEERESVRDQWTDSVYTKYLNENGTLSRNRTKMLEKARKRMQERAERQTQTADTIAKKNCYGKNK